MPVRDAAINYGTRARIGVILPSGNRAAEAQFASMLPAGVSMHVTRLSLADTSESALLGMAQDVESAARLLADVDPALILFHCTAVSTYSAELEKSIVARISGAADIPTTATSQAIVAALRALKALKIVMLSPYPEHIDAKEAAFLESSGFNVVRSASMPCKSVTEMMSITPDQWISFTLDNEVADADAYLLSCTAVRTAEVTQALEAKLGRPVITSNTSALWHCLRMVGVPDPVADFGRLLTI
ncbi:hypothetical protein [Pusillimonas sp.]|uniref:maleate cis-trans isomerase family protein n=1 Tax=Pusillimonas sp. TaxID=3040095 RepID=UPI0029B322A1|nr:hypothetical protein [Pusillimonas sp.]MDX3895562.1 hypothetical protein [Pusillimonas sp.]